MLGIAASCGISPSSLLRAGPIERELLLAAFEEAQAWQARYIEAQAVAVVNAYGRALRKSS